MKTNMKTIIKTSAIVLAISILSVGVAQAATFTMLTGQLDYGQTSTNVSNLQTFLGSNSSIYPQGLITGYFGPLTKIAVMNFQSVFGISQVGRVGPETLSKINSLILSGQNLDNINGNTVNDINAPIIYTPSVSVSRNGATINWATSELATSEIYYSTTPFQLAEAAGSGEPSIFGGVSTGETTSLQIGNSVSLQNLQSNTVYYYMIESTDASGNLQYTWAKTFVTSY